MHRPGSPRRPIRVVTALLVMALLAASTPAGAGAQAGESGDGFAGVTVRVSCLAGNGRVDVLLDNSGRRTDSYFLGFVDEARPAASLSRYVELERDDWFLQSVTGRADGRYTLFVSSYARPGGDVDLGAYPYEVNCDDAAARSSEPEIALVAACDFDAQPAASGVIATHFVNPTEGPKPYVIDVEGAPNRSTTAGAGASASRQISGLSDGDYVVRIRSAGRQIHEETVTIDCDREGNSIGQLDAGYNGIGTTSTFLDTAWSADNNPILVSESESEFGFSTLGLHFCTNPSCRGPEPDAVEIEGRHSGARGPASIAVKSSGIPVIAYTDGYAYSSEDEERDVGLAIAICSDPQCSSMVTRHVPAEERTVQWGGPYIAGASAVIGPSGNPLVSYYSAPAQIGGRWILRLATCLDPTCAEIVTTEFIKHPTAESDLVTNLTFGSDGKPTVTGALVTVACADEQCSSYEVTDLSTAGRVVAATSGPDGYPVLVQRVGAGEEQVHYVTDCADPRCAEATTSQLPAIPPASPSIGLAVSPTGNVAITHSLPLTVISCSDTSCVDPSTVEFDEYRGAHGAPVFQPNGGPLIVTSPYGPGGDEYFHDVIACATPTCGD